VRARLAAIAPRACAAFLRRGVHLKKVLLTAVAVVAVAFVATGVATAAPAKTDAQVIGNVQIDPTDATVRYVTTELRLPLTVFLRQHPRAGCPASADGVAN
jgi:hypothetical protein